MISKRSNTASAKGRDIAPGVPAQKGSVMEEVVRSVPDGLSPFGSSQQAVSPVPASIPSARPWQPWERNFSGGRIGVQEQQGRDDNWMILHVESGGAKTTTSLRPHETWDLALMLSPQLKARLDELFKQARAAEAALYSLTWRECDTDLLRRIADEHDCGEGCEYAGGRWPCPKIEREGCAFADAEQLRDLAKGIDLGNATIEADVLRVIDSCGGARGAESQEWSDGYNAALDAVERETRRLFAKAQAIEARRAETQSGSVADESAVAKPCAQGDAA